MTEELVKAKALGHKTVHYWRYYMASDGKQRYLALCNFRLKQGETVIGNMHQHCVRCQQIKDIRGLK